MWPSAAGGGGRAPALPEIPVAALALGAAVLAPGHAPTAAAFGQPSLEDEETQMLREAGVSPGQLRPIDRVVQSAIKGGKKIPTNEGVEVHRGKVLISREGRRVTMRVVLKKASEARSVRSLAREFSLLSSCGGSDFVVQLASDVLFYERASDGGKLQLIMVTKAAQRDVKSMIKDANTWATVVEVRTLAHDLAHGLRYLHDVINIVHRDIKPGNIVYTPSDHPTPERPGTFQICDLGSALPCDPAKGQILKAEDLEGFTEDYLPPEIGKHGGSYDVRLDICAMGFVVIEFATKQRLHEHKRLYGIHMRSLKAAHEELRPLLAPFQERWAADVPDFEAKLRAFFCRCTAMPPTARPFAKTICLTSPLVCEPGHLSLAALAAVLDDKVPLEQAKASLGMVEEHRARYYGDKFCELFRAVTSEGLGFLETSLAKKFGYVEADYDKDEAKRTKALDALHVRLTNYIKQNREEQAPGRGDDEGSMASGSTDGAATTTSSSSGSASSELGRSSGVKRARAQPEFKWGKPPIFFEVLRKVV